MALREHKGNGSPIQAFIPSISRSIANTSLSGAKKFAKDGSGDFSIKNCFALLVTPSAVCTYYYNTDTTKVKSIFDGTDNLIFVYQDDVVSVTIQFPATSTNEVQIME